MKIVVVESPAKAKVIDKYLGTGYKVYASYGHVRDLSPKDGSVEPDQDFLIHWEVNSDKSKQLNEISRALKDAEGLILATDPDREGEAISWHLLEVLRNKRKKVMDSLDVQRVTFNEITKKAVLEAMEEPRDLDENLISAYLARRTLDYLVGFTLSPVLWRKLPGARSAGRVQSVALRLVCDREVEIERFQAQEYWTIDGHFETNKKDFFKARLTHWKGEKLDKFTLGDEQSAQAARNDVQASDFTIAAIEKKPVNRNPWAPFTTASLQQEAARKLGFAASHTMRIAQQLYEGIAIDGETAGLITYMRTDGVTISNEAISKIRDMIAKEHGADYIPDKPRRYTSKAKNAQEAHEAIRPTDFGNHPKQISAMLTKDQQALYELIWKRTIASQMSSARFERTVVEMVSKCGTLRLRCNGQVKLFPGFLSVYDEDLDDRKVDEGTRLPSLSEGDRFKAGKVDADRHVTEPPPRFTEASLVKKLETLGIGRPSTYASILATLKDRDYVRTDRNRFIPEDKGLLVTAFLENFFERYVEYDFTAGLEDQLDDVSAGKIAWRAVLRAFWDDFHERTQEVLELKPSDVTVELDKFLNDHLFPPIEDGSDPRQCPTCKTGRLGLKTGRYGAFIACSNYPDCRYSRQLGQNHEEGGDKSDQNLGQGEGGLPILLRQGRFGPYLQLGETTGESKEKPKRVSIPKDVPLETVDLALALKLLELPRTIGDHPETGKPIIAGIGRYGPYINHDGKYFSISSTETALTIGMNQAVVRISEGYKGRGKGGKKEPLKLFGTDSQGREVKLLEGRYGPYVTNGDINATVPRGMNFETLTLEDAQVLIDAKAAKGPVKKKRRKASPKKTAGKKAASDVKANVRKKPVKTEAS